MNMTDNELIDYTIKFDNDPVRVRLATYMDRHPGAILDDLERAGMDETFCTFRSIVTETEYLPGQYITHLEGEISYLQEQLDEAYKEIEELKPMKVSELIEHLRQEITTEKHLYQQANRSRYEAEQKCEEMKNKLDMWAILNR
jgi:predicted RNase H-like nuclease (RuvC/YqgF family)